MNKIAKNNSVRYFKPKRLSPKAYYLIKFGQVFIVNILIDFVNQVKSFFYNWSLITSLNKGKQISVVNYTQKN